MSETKKIMMAIAFSKYSQEKFNYAAQMAKDLDAQLIVANVINSRDVEAVSRVESMGYKVDTDEYIKGVEEERRTLLNDIVNKSSFLKEKMKTIFRVGNPFDQLIKIIKEEGIDLVVIGAKGRTDLGHVFVGSVAEKMFRHSPVPVVIYRTKGDVKNN